ncbi:MAG: VWA domain-containing protein [Metallosphaera sp.]|uniref:VWA domain-containing protein n=1 Tax=Metallosphaera sp. TaxID=2020860 RepID=UPI00316A81CB
MRRTFPFSAIVGQEKLKKALLIVAVDSTIAGVLIKGPKGVAKSTAVRALANLLPEIEVVADCPFSCDPDNKEKMCSSCRSRIESGEKLPRLKRKKKIVDLPVSATLDRVVGTLDIKKILKEGERGLEPGLLAQANRGILYIDEVNLLPDDVVNAILDAASSKYNVVEREGVSIVHPADFILIGTMNPEEGELRPQLLDRFAISVEAEAPKTPEELIEISNRVEEFERTQEKFLKAYEEEEEKLKKKIYDATLILPRVTISEAHLKYIADTILTFSASTRAMIYAVKVAKALASLDGRVEVNERDVKDALELVLSHRVPNFDRSSLPNVSKNERSDTSESPTFQGNTQWKEELSNRVSKERDETEPNHSEISIPKSKVKGTGFGKGGLFDSILGKYRGEGLHLDLYASLINMALHKRSWLEPQDLSIKGVESTGALPILLLLDSSKSMEFSKRISLAKSILKGLLIKAYQIRSKVGLVTFSGFSSEYVVPITKNFKKVESSIEAVRPSGKTPISSALALAIQIINRETRSRRGVLPIVFLISDGKANVGLRNNIANELSELSSKLGKISKVIVIDTSMPHQPSFNNLISSKANGILIRANNFITDLHI